MLSFRESQPRPAHAKSGVVSASVLVLAVLVGCADESQRELEKETRSNLLQIGIALTSYQSSQGAFPPAVVSDEAGELVQSWRGILLPYTEKDSPPFDPKLAWNSKENTETGRQLIRIYCGDRAKNNTARFLAVVGDDCLLQSNRSLNVNRLSAPLSEIAIVVDVGETDIPWSQPKDLSLEDFLGRFDKRTIGPFADGFYTLFADGSVRQVPYSTPKEKIKAMFTVEVKSRRQNGD